ncbi:MAG: asparaginase [Candidatus Buchananbacteria bacterium]|nr:asparaginase [Candidatus Buchananbacteria bacterium]
MTRPRPKVALIICGSYPNIKPDQIASWVKSLSELNIVAEVKPFLIFQKSSTNVESQNWLELFQIIKKNAGNFVGFVVLHDFDNIVYTAAALSFLTLGLNKPIVLTSGQTAKDQSQFESRANLINAIQSASVKINEVCLMFGNKLIRGSQAQFSQIEAFNKFDAPLEAIFGRVDFGVRIFKKLLIKKANGIFKPSLNQNILTIHLQPDLDYQTIAQVIDQKQGIVINAKHHQHLPEKLITILTKNQNLPVVICWSQKNENEQLAKIKNFISVDQLTWPTAVVKTMWALAQTKNIKKVKDLMATNIAGEIL